MFDRHRYNVDRVRENEQLVSLVQRDADTAQFRVVDGACNGTAPECQVGWCAHVSAAGCPGLYRDGAYLDRSV